MGTSRKLIVLGNCVAERLGLLLQALFRRQGEILPGLAVAWEVETVPPVHNLPDHKAREEVARKALDCDLVFSQPLFNYGPCNTGELRDALGERLHTFSAPNFEAYFPDAIDIRPLKSPEKFPPPLEWHSRIFIQARAAGLQPHEAEVIYFSHPLFQPAAMCQTLRRGWEIYERREAGVEIGTLALAREYFDKEPLFYTWNHPGDRVFRHLLQGMLQVMGISGADIEAALARIPWKGVISSTWSDWGFGFNAWPIITRNHKFFSFQERDWFRMAGRQVDILTAAIAWYSWYDAHPDIFEQALQSVLAPIYPEG